MKKVVIVPNAVKDGSFAVTDLVATKLLDLGFGVYIHSEVHYDKCGTVKFDEFPLDADLIIVIGGDGSVIDASGVAIEQNIPMLGVNLGKVGYLTEVDTDEIYVLDKLISGEYSVIEKMLLSVEFGENGKAADRYAVNDIVISRNSLSNIAEIKVEDSLENSVKFRADGVILATPQGSTAYSFSTGGPVVAHDVESILLTPVSPHSFFNRSVIFNSSDVIKVTNSGEFSLSVNVDGRCVKALEPGEYCKIKRAEKVVKMLTFKENSMFSSLFRKMRILGDID